MKERLIELVKNAHNEQKYITSDKSINAIADYLLANGVIVPPCKVGEAIYRCGKHNVFEWQIEFIQVFADEIGFVDESYNYFSSDDIGKTVFLTKEEAEQALKGGAKMDGESNVKL